MKKDFIMPVLVLTLICLVMSGALAAVNSITQPLIEESALERAETARREIIPEADEFILLEAGGLPKSITEVYAAANDTGYIFMITAPGGYGGAIKMICGIDPDGTLIKSAVLAHAETQGLGTVVFDRAGDNYDGKNKNGAENIDAIAGATITSNAYKNGVLDAFEAFEKVKITKGEQP